MKNKINRHGFVSDGDGCHGNSVCVSWAARNHRAARGSQSDRPDDVFVGVWQLTQPVPWQVWKTAALTLGQTHRRPGM